MNTRILMRNRNKCLVCLFLLLVEALATASYARLPKYGLKRVEVKRKTFLQVYRKDTRQVIWTRSGYHAVWSKDHRAVAFLVPPLERFPVGGIEQYFALATWRAGERVHVWPGYFNADYVEDMIWSPRDSHLLIGVGSSGADSIGYEITNCVNLNSRSDDGLPGWVATSDNSSVPGPRWVNESTIKYWTISMLQDTHGNPYYLGSKQPFYHRCR